MNVEASQTKYLIIDWEIYTKGTRKYWKIIRVGNHTEVHQFFDDMLKAFDRDDLVMLWSLVKETFNSTEPTDDKEKEIWVELKRLFVPDTDDELWKLQKHIHDLTWRLDDSCGSQNISSIPLSRGTLTLMLVTKLLVEQDNEMSRELLRKIFMQILSWDQQIETLSLDDLFNNLKAYESEVKGTSSSTTNSGNVAFLSAGSTNSATRAVNTAQGVNTAKHSVVQLRATTTVKNLSDADIFLFSSQPVTTTR
ncbi:hypothetical protein Tco_1363080 [Tanacetum coccineum]